MVGESSVPDPVPQKNISKKSFREFPVFTVLPNLKKQTSLICLLSILKVSQPDIGSVLIYSPRTLAYNQLSVELILKMFHKHL
jgi:hypothetical protein